MRRLGKAWEDLKEKLEASDGEALYIGGAKLHHVTRMRAYHPVTPTREQPRN